MITSMAGILLGTIGFAANIREQDPRSYTYIKHQTFELTYDLKKLEEIRKNIEHIIDSQLIQKLPCKIIRGKDDYYITNKNDGFYIVKTSSNETITHTNYDAMSLYIFIIETNGAIWTVREDNETTPLFESGSGRNNKCITM
jgi:hypothetical protein